MTDHPDAETDKVTIFALPPELDAAVAPILADATAEGTATAASAVLAAARADPACGIFGARAGDTLVAVYITRKNPPSFEVTHVAVPPEFRRRGYGRACLTAALYQAGMHPLVAETDDDALPFYKACGFRIVSRHLANGRFRYRLGTYVPRPGAEHFPGGHLPPTSPGKE